MNSDINRTSQHSYQIIRTLGKGTFGTTFLVKKDNIDDTKTYVLKRINLLPHKMTEIFQEVNVLRKIAKYGCKSRILCFHEHFVNPNDQTINIVTEAFDNAITLGEFIRNLQKERRYLKANELLKIFHNLLEGLAYLHKIGIAHGDIKPDNILINTSLDTQIIDFGLSCSKHCKPSGTVLFASPEILSNIGSRHEISIETLQTADVFSMGLVFFLLANLEFPFTIINGNPYQFDIDSINSSSNSSISSYEDSPQLPKNEYEINGGNQFSLMYSLQRFYQSRGTVMFSSFRSTTSATLDKQINEFIESMIIIQTKQNKGRPSAHRLLANLKHIIKEYNSTFGQTNAIAVSPITPNM